MISVSYIVVIYLKKVNNELSSTVTAEFCPNSDHDLFAATKGQVERTSLS